MCGEETPIVACLKCGGTDLKPLHTPRGAFTGLYHCQECDQAGPVVLFDDVDSYVEFRDSLKQEREE